MIWPRKRLSAPANQSRSIFECESRGNDSIWKFLDTQCKIKVQGETDTHVQNHWWRVEGKALVIHEGNSYCLKNKILPPPGKQNQLSQPRCCKTIILNDTLGGPPISHNIGYSLVRQAKSRYLRDSNTWAMWTNMRELYTFYTIVHNSWIEVNQLQPTNYLPTLSSPSCRWTLSALLSSYSAKAPSRL